MPPLLSVIALTIDNYQTLRTVLEHVHAQSLASQIELILVCPDKRLLNAPVNAAEGYHSLQVVEHGFATRGGAAVAGIRAALADVVVMVEDHAYPKPGWAAALLREHKAGVAAVGPTIENANPHHTVSWADLLTGYGRLVAPQVSGPATLLAGHNCSYNREVLLRHCSDKLDDLLNVEVVLHEQMRELGLSLHLCDEARICHVNFELMSSWLRAQFHHGRLHASMRGQQWPTWNKMFFALGSPLIPFLRMRRTLNLPAAANAPSRLKLCVALLAGNAVSAAGEVLGCFLGPGGSATKLLPLEFHRYRHFQNQGNPARDYRYSAVNSSVAPSAASGFEK